MSSLLRASSIKAVLIDLSGTLHIENTAVPGAVEALKRLKSSSVKVCFITNTTKECKRTLLNKLHSCNFDILATEVFTSLTATRVILEQNCFRPFFILEDDALNDFDTCSDDEPNAVVIGLAPNKCSYETMNKAFNLLMNGCSLIAIHKGKYYQSATGLSIGPGAFVKGLEYSTGVKAEVVGKPTEKFFRTCLEYVSCSPEETIMIGDDVTDDVGGAQKIGIRGILVKTGKYRENDESKITPPPFHVSKDFPQAVNYVLENLVS